MRPKKGTKNMRRIKIQTYLQSLNCEIQMLAYRGVGRRETRERVKEEEAEKQQTEERKRGNPGGWKLYSQQRTQRSS